MYKQIKTGHELLLFKMSDKFVAGHRYYIIFVCLKISIINSWNKGMHNTINHIYNIENKLLKKGCRWRKTVRGDTPENLGKGAHWTKW